MEKLPYVQEDELAREKEKIYHSVVLICTHPKHRKLRIEISGISNKYPSEKQYQEAYQLFGLNKVTSSNIRPFIVAFYL